MEKIDFSPDSAPLSGATTPSIDDINSLAQTHDRVVWRPPAPTPAMVSLSDWGFPLAILAGFAAYILLSLIPLAVVELRVLTAKATPLPPLSAASTVYAVLKAPTAADLDAMNAAAAAGVRVTLIYPSTVALPPGQPSYSLFPVDSTNVVSEGYLLNGFQWYPKTKLPGSP